MNEIPLLIGVDPGFTAMGIAEVTLLPHEEIVRRVAVVRTAKRSEKGVRVIEDELRRVKELGAALGGWLSDGVIAICMEEQGHPPKASRTNIRKMAYPVAVVGALAGERGIPVLPVPPKRLKQTLTGSGTATKKAVKAALEARYGEIEWPKQSTLHEHASDALAAIVACLDHTTIQMARRLMG